MIFFWKIIKIKSHVTGGYIDLSNYAAPTIDTESNFEDTQIFEANYLRELQAKGIHNFLDFSGIF